MEPVFGRWGDYAPFLYNELSDSVRNVAVGRMWHIRFRNLCMNRVTSRASKVVARSVLPRSYPSDKCPKICGPSTRQVSRRLQLTNAKEINTKPFLLRNVDFSLRPSQINHYFLSLLLKLLIFKHRYVSHEI